MELHSRKMSKTVLFSPFTIRLHRTENTVDHYPISGCHLAGQVISHIHIQCLGLLATAESFGRFLYPQFLGIDKLSIVWATIPVS